MISLDPPTLDAQILESVVAPDEPTLPPTLARAVLKLSFRPEQQQEVEKLLDRNNAGTISRRERERLEAYVRVGNFLSLLQAKARGTLSSRQSGSRGTSRPRRKR